MVLVVPELDRIRDFADFRALHPDQANEGGLGNLPGQLSPLEGLGIWPTSEFRLSASASSLPAVVFYAGGLFALVALALALPRWIRRHGSAIPAALAAAAVLYLFARGLGTVYTSAKALSIAAPLVALVTLGGLLAASARPLRWLGAAFALAAAFCSFLILRQAPVAPAAHADELARIRPLVEGEKLLFLGRDNFVLYELRGSKPYTHVRNFYDPYFVEPNFELAQVGSKFDFDSVTARTLAGFPYVLTTRAGYASGPPPGYRVIERTDSYELWEKGRSPIGREPAETGPEPGRERGCPPGRPSESSAFAAPPVVAGSAEWSRATIESGESATVELELPTGIWDLSLQYDSTRAGDPDRGGRAPRPDPAGQPRLSRDRPVLARGPDRGRRRGAGDDHRPGRGPAARGEAAGRALGRPPGGAGGDQRRAGPRRLFRLRRLVRGLMDISFGAALLIFGSLLAVTAALSGLIRGTVLSASVLSIVLGIVLAELDVVSVDVGDDGHRRADRAGADPDPGLRRPARRSRAARAPLGPGRRGRWCSRCRSPWSCSALGAKLLFADLDLGRGVPARRGALRHRPGGHLVGRHARSGCPSSIRHTLNLESGLNDGLALPFVLFFLVLASPGGDAGQRGRSSWSARPPSAP